MILRQWQEPWETDPKQSIDYLEVLLNLRHGSYSFPDGDLEVIVYAPDSEYREDPAYYDEKGCQPLSSIPKEDLESFDPDDLEWGTIIRIIGKLHSHDTAFQLLAASLMPSLDPSGRRPGGDDDYFDYWPGGMEALRDYAIDLDKAYKAYWAGDYYTNPGFLGVYDHVLLDFLIRERCRGDDWLWEHVPDLINELAEDLKISYDKAVKLIERKAAA